MATIAPTGTDSEPERHEPPTRPPGLLLGLLVEAGQLFTFSGAVAVGLWHTPRYLSEVMRHAATMMRSTWFLMLAMQFFFGMSVVNFGFFLLQALGAQDYLGLVTALVGPRQAVPQMFGYVFAAKICCGMTAELGAMKVNEEIDAYETTGVDPRSYVVGTRMLAVVMFVPFATAISLAGAVIGNYFDAVTVLHGVSPHVLLSVNWSNQSVTDQLFALGSIMVIALLTGLVACFYGLRTNGGPDSVGTSVSRSLIVNLVLIHVVLGCLAVFVYGTNLRIAVSN